MVFKKRISKNILEKSRIEELDFLRGIALIMMIYFHTIRSMHEIFGYQVSYTSLRMIYLGKFSAILFIFISGIVFSFSRNSYKRIILLSIIALIISIITYIYDSSSFIKFGIIHFFAISWLLGTVFKKLNTYTIGIVGIVVIIAGFRIPQIPVHTNYLSFLGLRNGAFQSLDYYPLLPRFGVYLLGIFIARLVYKDKKSIIGNKVKVGPINFIGRHSLAIYLFHQPIIIGCLYLISK